VLRRERESLARATSHYRQLSNRDALTGIYNLRYFRDHLAPMVVEAQIRGEPLSLIMADIDNFKKYNDAHGHPEGDKVLVGMGQAITHACAMTTCPAAMAARNSPSSCRVWKKIRAA
jgi:PleD family two-component response regulator